MKFGTLQVFPRQGLLQEHGLELPSAVVGRGEGSAILIDDFSVARRHARLTVDSGRLMVEDLGSASGTFIDGERLEPGVRHLIEGEAAIRFGDIEARYLAPAGAESAELATVPGEVDVVTAGGLSVALVSPQQPLEAGRHAAATLVVSNRGRIVDNVAIEVTDLPADWYTIESPAFPILPGGRADVRIALHPPRRHDSLVGQYTFTVRVRSQEYDAHPETTGTFDVLPFESATLNLAAVRSKKKFRLVAENLGNEMATYELSGRDDELAFGYWFETPVVELEPGQKRIVEFHVKRKGQLFGVAKQPPFEILGKSQKTGAEISARGQLAITPPLERFKMPAMFAMIAIVLLATVVAVLIVADNGSNTALAEDPYAGVHLCEDADAKAEQEERNADAANAAPRENAVVVGPYDGGQPITFGEVDRNGAPFFAQSDARWATEEYARSTELPNGKDWCGTTIEQCGCAMTSVSVMLALYDLLEMPDGSALSPKALNDWFNGAARQTDRGWVSRGYIYGDVIWSAANELSGEIAKTNPEARTVRFVRTGSGSEEEIRADLEQGRPVILEVPGHWIAAVGLDGDDILINDPFYRDRQTLDAYAGKVRSSVHYEPSTDLSSVVITAPADVKFKVTDKQGRVVNTGTGSFDQPSDVINQIPGASIAQKHAWRDPTCIESAPPEDAGTNQIVLPGSRDDYIIEILDAGAGDSASVAVHTYGRDGTSSIATIEGQEGTQAELEFDPNADKPVINISNNGTPVATATPPNADGAGGGDDEDDETPTTVPTAPPPPTATATPFVEQRTAMTLPAEPGQTRVEVATNSGFELGDPVRFAPGQPNEEDNIIVGFGSFILATPLKFSHSPGEPIQRLARPPGQGPGLPPGITPPPDTGPIEPPDSVIIACSTIYQPSPKLATLICDLNVAGDFTTTRWTFNGKIVQEFSGATSMVMSFPGDVPANVSATVCNQTLCRSTSKLEKIEFPPNLNGPTQTGVTTSGGPGTVAPPPPAGTVAVVCGTEFPITPDGQVAQFDCQANFAGNYTSISWSAPGGSPANKSGTSKEFTTFITNSDSTPPSIKITATVCNFGVCRTSAPAEVGITQTITTIDSSPISQVHQGHKLTLMARVQSTGKSVPQGGTVQFYADGEDDAFAIGGSATLFTTGSVAVAIEVVDTNTLSTAGSSGTPHNFLAVYSGGTNAFGSKSEQRIITVLPPIPDGCDSVNNDGDPDHDGQLEDNVTDGTCEFAVPRDLGAGTVLSSLQIAGDSTVIQDGATNAVIVDPGDTLNIAATVSRSAPPNEYCPGCIRQVYIGIGGYDPVDGDAALATRIGPVCIASGGFPPAPSAIPGGYSVAAPTAPGVYYLRATTTLDYFCVGPQVGPPEFSVGRIIVRQAITANVQIWNDGPVWPAPPASQGDPLVDPLQAPRAEVSGISEDQRVVLRAQLPPGAVGRVEFLTDPPNVLKVNGAVPSAQVCPANGIIDMPAGTADIACFPWEARIRTDEIDAVNEPITVTAKYIDPDPLIAPDPLDNVAPFDTNTYNIRFPATPSSNTVNLKVLAPAAVTVTGPATPVAMGSTFTLTAEVESVDSGLGLDGEGGFVQFRAGTNNFGPPIAVDADGRATITWRAGINDPLCTPTPCGGFPFDTKDDNDRSLYDDVYAEYRTGGASLLQDACLTSHTQANCFETDVDIDPAGSSVTIIEVKSGSSGALCDALGDTTITAGECITVTAEVTGVPGFPPTGGDVDFLAAGGSLSSDEGSIGNAAAAETSQGSGIYRATITFVTGTANDQMDTPGSYTLKAQFKGTSALDGSESADFAVTLGKEAASVAITAPASGSTLAAGTTTTVNVDVSASNTGFLHQQSATIQLYNGATPLGTAYTLTSGDAGKHNFSLRSLAPGTYNFRAVYSGNNFYLSAESAPADCSIGCIAVTITKSAANISLDNLTRTQDVSPTGSNSVGDQFSIRARVNPNQTPSSAGGLITLTATIDGTTTTLATHTLVGEGGEHVFSLDTSTGVLLTTSEISFSIDYGGNADLNAGSLATPVTLTLAKGQPTVSVLACPSDTPACTGSPPISIGSSVSVTYTITSPAGIATACPTATPNCVELRVGTSTGTPIATVPVGTGFNALTTGGSSGTCLDSVSSTAGCQILVRYTGNDLLNADDGSDTIVIQKAVPEVNVAEVSVTAGNNFTLTATITAPTGSGNPDCTACVQFRVGSTTGTAIGTKVDVVNGIATRSGVASGTSPFNASATPYNVFAVYDSNATFASASGSDTVTVSKASSTTVVAGPGVAITWNTDGTLTATVTPGVVGVSPACTNCIQFRVGAAVATATVITPPGDPTNQNLDVNSSGVSTVSITAGGTNFGAPGSYTIWAVYGGNTNLAASTSASATVTIGPATTTLDARGSSGTAVGAVTLTATVSSNFGAGTDIDSGTITWTITGGAGACTRPAGAALTATIVNGTATLTDVTCPVGNNYDVRGTYSGGGDYAASADTTDDDLDVD